MKKLASELKRGDKIELLNGEIGTVLRVIQDETIEEHSAIYYENGSRTFVLTDEEIEIL
jgi:preprotein translocase subunit YajC